MAPPPYRPDLQKPVKPLPPLPPKTRAAVVSGVVIALSTAGILAPPPFNVVARAAAAIVGLFQ